MTRAHGETTGPLGVRLTSPDKVLWPDAGVTKAMLADYYATMADRLLDHVKDRPLSVVRCPDGATGECFFQKHRGTATPPEIDAIDIREADGEVKDYLVVRDAKGLVACAQIGVLELHVWGVRADQLEKPERMIFDLDPDEGLGFADVRAAACEVRDRLDAVGLSSFALLTGGKGVHVIAPLARRNDWAEVKGVARGLADALAHEQPDRFVATAAKAKRGGRIFIDWLRNERGSTAIAPYSPRRRPGAPVATPVSWQELEGIDAANAFTLSSIGKRLAGLNRDPWEGYGDVRQSLTAKVRKALG